MQTRRSKISVRGWQWIRFSFVALVGAVCVTGCVDRAGLFQLRNNAESIREEVVIEAERVRQDSIQPDLPVEYREASADAYQHLQNRLDDLDRAIATLDSLLESEQKPESVWSAVSDSAIPLLPEPLRSPAILLGAFAVAVARAAQLKRAAGSIAKGIAKASEKDEEFRSVFQRHADTFRTVQTPAAKRIIDEKVTPGFMMRLPI
jgi:hypothetical protein